MLISATNSDFILKQQCNGYRVVTVREEPNFYIICVLLTRICDLNEGIEMDKT